MPIKTTVLVRLQSISITHGEYCGGFDEHGNRLLLEVVKTAWWIPYLVLLGMMLPDSVGDRIAMFCVEHGLTFNADSF